MIHPPVERAAVVEHAVQDHSDPAHVRLAHQLREQPVTRLEVGRIGHPRFVFGRFAVIQLAFGEDLAVIVHYFAKVRVNMVIILCIVFVV